MFELSLGGMLYEGWTKASVTRSVKDLTGSFQVTLHDPMMLLLGSPLYTAFSANAEPGSPVQVFVAGELFLTGMIDSRTATKSATAHDVQISGRGKSRDLVDSSHDDQKTQYNDQTPSQIVKKVAEPFGQQVKVRLSGGERPIPKYRYFPGDNAFDVSHEVARQQGITINEDKTGNLVMRDRAQGPAAGALVQGVNLLTYSVEKSDKDQFGKYKAKGQSVPGKGGRGKTANQRFAQVEDASVKGNRVLVRKGESDIDDGKIKKRALHEAARRSAGALRVSVTLYGYRGETGALWEPDTLAMTIIPDEKVAEMLLIESVTFTKDASGTITKLDLVRKEAYEAQPSEKTSLAAPNSPKISLSAPAKIGLGQ
jgi:prophage tail gpP-like protein